MLMRMLVLVLAAAAFSSALTLLVVRPADGSATTPASHQAGPCGAPPGAKWLCSGDGFFVPGIKWSCSADNAKALPLPSVFSCSKGGSARTAYLALVLLTKDRIRVFAHARPSVSRRGNGYESVFLVNR
jgi:hypothetical protein